MPATRQAPTSTSHHLRVLLESGAVAGLSDGELLDRFTRERDEAAFTALIERHGPMVQRLCSDVMGNHHDAEDAFQATFLVLARHARSIRRPDSIASWLHGVAIRVSAAARSAAARRRTHERNRAALQVEQATVDEPGSDTLAAHVHAEVARLPDRFRGPVVLCYLEGRTYGEAAQHLHCPIGTIKSRLATARDRLQRRLKQQPSAAAFAGSHDWEQHRKPHIAAVPISLVESTVAAVMKRGAQTAAALAASTSAVMSTMKLKLVCYSAMVIAALAGIAFAVNHERAENPAKPGRPPQRATGLLEQQPATDREIRTVFLRVLDRATRQPLTGVTVTLSIDFKVAREFVTDPSGRVVIPLPARNFDHATVTARKDGLPPMRVYLRRPDAPDLEVPRSLALEMGGATSIGGIVRDEAGRPIAGASVKIAELTPSEGGREVFDASAVSTQTDIEGRWRIDIVPADLDLARLQVAFTHPDFLTMFESSRYLPPPTPEQLRSMRAVTVLTRGVTVSGRVLDLADRPVAGAAVMLTRRRDHGPTLKTDAEGRFQFRSAPAAESLLTVRAEGLAPEARSVRLRPGLPPFEFRLGPGRTIRGTVVDSKGKAIVGANVAVSRWNGPRAFDWRVQTDAQGRFRLNGLPDERISLTAWQKSYRVEEMFLEATATEAVFHLSSASPLRIKGTVTDAVTSQPIQTFAVVPSVEPGGILMVDFTKTHHGGEYVFAEVRNGQPYRIHIEAKGYLRASSPQYPHDGGEHVFDARLEPGRWVEGIVRGDGGEPLSAAEVILAEGNGVSIQQGRSYQREHHRHVLTGVDGQFAFSPPEGDARIVVLHDRGYAEALAAPDADGLNLEVKPWGRIEGALRVDGKPLARETIVADLDEKRSDSMRLVIQTESRAQTDEQGHFVIDRLAPGEARLWWQPERHGAKKDPSRFYRPVFLTVLHGQTAHAEIVQGGGPSLRGKIVLSEEKATHLDAGSWGAYLVAASPDVPCPPNLVEADRKVWLHLWRFTAAAEAYRAATRGFGHRLELEPDGSFRLDDIQPGAYELRVDQRGRTAFTHRFVVPKPDRGAKALTVDLGAINFPAAAQRAPAE